MSALTRAQRHALNRAVDNGGTIEIGSLDGDKDIRRDVIYRLYESGLLALDSGATPHNWVTVWRITDAGRKAIAKAVTP